MSISSIIGLFKAFLFLFPFTLEWVFGRAANPYSRNPKDWDSGKPKKTPVLLALLIVGILSVILNAYLTTRLFKMGTDVLVSKKELEQANKRIHELSNEVVACVAPVQTENTCPQITYTPEKIEVVKEVIQTKPPIKTLNKEKQAKQDAEEYERKNTLFLKRLRELERLE